MIIFLLLLAIPVFSGICYRAGFKSACYEDGFKEGYEMGLKSFKKKE